MTNSPFRDKSILITAASGGIGTATSERLAKQGCSLVLTARRAEKLNELASRLTKLGAAAVSVIPADMADYSSVGSFAKQLSDRDIHLDGCVFMVPQPHRAAETMPPNEEWDKLFKTSFIGPLALLKAAIARMTPDLAQGKRCKIAVVSGISSAQILSHYASANVIRCAWVGQAKTLAFALGPKGIHVNTLSLGGTLSPWYVESIRERATKAGKSYEDFLIEDTLNVPLRKYGTPEEVATVLEGLLSSFSDHMSGVNIMHDGGFTRAY